MKSKINLKKGLKFQCQGSGNCCVSRGNYGFVYLSKEDLKKLSIFFEIKQSEFKIQFCSNTDGFMHLKELKKNKGNCIFLKDKKCTVYKARPIQCRTWPFWNENMNAKTWNENISKFCPGIGKRKNFSEKENLEILDKDLKNDKSIIDYKINLQK